MIGARSGPSGPSPASRFDRVARRVDRLARVVLAAVLLGPASCVAPTGGWDVAALLEAEPGIESIPGQRIGDLLPFPALIDGRLWLVACRFPTGSRVAVVAGGEHWPGNWGRRTVAAVDRSLPALELVLMEQERPDAVALPSSRIEIVSMGGPDSEGPLGLGDTSTECDVGVVPGDPSAVKGLLRHATIRLRRSRLDSAGLIQPARDDEWAGALAHELAHALGFPSHVAVGRSLLVREEGQLRRTGRRALAGRPIDAPTLTALYRLAPGRILGEVPISRSTFARLDAWGELLAEISTSEGEPPVGPLARVGDRAARLVWRWPGGRFLALDMPGWRDELRAGALVTVIARSGRRAEPEAGFRSSRLAITRERRGRWRVPER
jgi:hypothetical protein